MFKKRKQVAMNEADQVRIAKTMYQIAGVSTPKGISFLQPAPQVTVNRQAENHFEEQKQAIDAFVILVDAQVRGLCHEVFSMVLSAIRHETGAGTTARVELQQLMEAFDDVCFLTTDDVVSEARQFILDTFKKPRESVDQETLEGLLREISQAMREQVLATVQTYDESQGRCERSW